MNIARVLGTVVSTVHHPDYHAKKLLIVQPLDEKLKQQGDSFLAIDTVQAGVGDLVLVMREGNGVRQIFNRKIMAVRSLIVGIIDEIDYENS